MEKIDRRSFLRIFGAGGALIATSQLPVIASPYAASQNEAYAASLNDPSFASQNEASAASLPSSPDGSEEKEPKLANFARRGRFERLSLSYSTVKIGLDEPFSILHITDTHFSDAYPEESETKQKLRVKRTRTFGGLQEMALRDSLDWAKEHADYVIHTGDMIDWQSEANYDLVKKYFGDAMIGSMGNHEFTPDMGYSVPKCTIDEPYKDLSREKLQDVYPFDISFQSQIAHGVNFITMDDVYGYVTAEQVRRFKEEVKRGYPIVLCMHVPFYSDDMWRQTRRYWDGRSPFRDISIPERTGDYKRQLDDAVTRDFIAYLKKQKLLKAILAGHEHIDMEERFSKTAMQYVTGGNFLFHGRALLFI